MENRHYLSSLFDPDAVALIVAPGPQPSWVDDLRRQLGGARARSAVFECDDDASAAAGAKDGSAAAERFDLAIIAVGRHSPRPALDMAIGLGVRAVTVICDRLDAHEVAALA
ncbi:MAG: hypothetical protein J0H09_02670, partial [Burkholderiales bacterium]|nr:hypothetical protein [Burkholderiales bacterium]